MGIEMRRVDGTADGADRLLAWIGIAGGDAWRASVDDPERGLMLRTADGVFHVPTGYWIVAVDDGNFYSWRGDVS